jgi:hypothetical protein
MAEENPPKKEQPKGDTAETDARLRKLKIDMAAILTAIWTGTVGYQVYAKYMVHEELAMLAAVGLVVGAVLTIAAFLYGVKMAEIVAGSKPGTDIATFGPPSRTREG